MGKAFAVPYVSAAPRAVASARAGISSQEGTKQMPLGLRYVDRPPAAGMP